MKLNFTIFKNGYKKENSNQPDFIIYTMEQNEWGVLKNKKIGGCWSKNFKETEGNYLSCSIDDEWRPSNEQQTNTQQNNNEDTSIKDLEEKLKSNT